MVVFFVLLGMILFVLILFNLFVYLMGFIESKDMVKMGLVIGGIGFGIVYLMVFLFG